MAAHRDVSMSENGLFLIFPGVLLELAQNLRDFGPVLSDPVWHETLT